MVLPSQQIIKCKKKRKESKKIDRYLDLARKQKKQQQTNWNMRVTVISIVVGALGTVPKSFGKGLKQWFLNFFGTPLHRQTKMPAPPSSNERQNDGNVKCHKNWLILQLQTV